jgi:hypothetical protein
MVEERAMRSRRRNEDWDKGYDGRNDRYNDRNDRYNDKNDRYNDRYDRRNGGYNSREDDNNRAVSEHSFNSMMQTLKREYSENSRVNLARQIIDRNYFTTQQVRYMLQLFPFEHHKLDLAKYAYRNTTDQENYFSIYEVFTYSNSKEQLADYIRRYR